MATKAKHAERSKRSYHNNVIPVHMFAAHAQKVAEAQFIRRMVKASEVAADAVDAEQHNVESGLAVPPRYGSHL